MPLADGNVEDVQLKGRSEAHGKKPLFLGNRKRTLQGLSSKNHSNLVHGSIRENKKSLIQNEATQNPSGSTPGDCLERKQSGQLDARMLKHSPDETQTALKEWNALYTSQITKKSKTYHDGILRLVCCGSHINQVILLNEDGTVLSTKYLKSVECIETGRDYAFPNYLIQICESRTHPGDKIPVGSLEEAADCKSSRRNNLMSNLKVTGGNPMPNAIQNVHSKGVDCGVSNDASFIVNDTKSIHDEWSALYTAQKNQKAKKYHDGILRVVNCGSRMKQAILLNEEGDVLNSKYLKQTDLVETGHTYEFPNYLVEVCELKVPVGDIQNEHSEKAANCISSGNGRLNNLYDKQIPNEWSVLFTTQMTQKSKTFHDGILRITNCGPQTKQDLNPVKNFLITYGSLSLPFTLSIIQSALVILSNEEGTVLSSMYLKSAECVRNGHKFEFPNYLVEICAQRAPAGDGTPEGPFQKVAGPKSTSTDKFMDARDDCSHKTFLEDVQKGCSEEVTADCGTSTRLNDRPLRDASQILSFLRRPVHTTQPSNVILLDVEGKNKVEEANIRKPSTDNHRGEHQSGGNTVVMHGGCHGDSPSQECYILSNRLPGNVANEMPPIEIDVEYTSINSEPQTSELSESNAIWRPVDSTDNVASSSGSSQEENLSADQNKSLTDEIKVLQEEWMVLSRRVSTNGYVKSPPSVMQTNTHSDKKCGLAHPSGETLFVCEGAEPNSVGSELQSTSYPCLDVEEFPTFDLGFE